jgi:hypothetical protein
MTNASKLILSIFALFCWDTTYSQQVPIPVTPSQVPAPAKGVSMSKEYVQTIGQLAYVWGYPLVNMYARRLAMEKVPAPGLSGGIIPVAPVGHLSMLTNYIEPQENFVACPNQDVVYGAGFAALDKEPVVFQVPDFGDRFWVYALYDGRTDEFAQLGKQYGTKPGFYLIVGPNWQGKAPAGINAVIRSSTNLTFAIPRIFKEDSAQDTQALLPYLNKVMFYPLSQYDGKIKTTDWSKSPSYPAAKSNGSEVAWVDPGEFYEQLSAVMKQTPPLPGEEALYQTINSVFDAASKDSSIQKALTDAFVKADKEIVGPLFDWKNNGVLVGNGWRSTPNGARWGTDYLSRLATAKSNIFENAPNETKYFYRDFDAKGQQLLGKNSVKITFSKDQLPPVKGFWSITLYNEKHFFYPNALKQYSLGTKNKNLKFNHNGSLTLYFGVKSPGKDLESNWLPAPDGKYSLYIRAYWAEESVLNGGWVPPNLN